MIWTVLTVTKGDTIVSTYDVDGAGFDEDRWLYKWAHRDGYDSRGGYAFTITTEMR